MPTLLALLFACAGNKTVETANPMPAPEAPSTAKTTKPSGPAADKPKVRTPTTVSTASFAAPSPAYARRASTFAQRFYEGLSDPATNSVTSGVSAAFALGMLAEGADSSTREAFEALFDAPLVDLRVDNARALVAYQQSEEIALVNGLWPDAGTTLDEAVSSVLRGDYRAEPTPLPLSRDPARAKATIDAWTERATHGMITELFAEHELAGARLVLANAIAFKGVWAQRFDPEQTTPAPFRTPNGEVEVAMMRARKRMLRTTTGVGYRAVKIPYASGQTALIIVLPDEGRSLADAMDGLAADNLAALGYKGVGPVDLSLPRFEIRSDHDLLAEADDLGLRPVFSGAYPGFGGLQVSRAIQRAVIRVDEDGTEAAAVTGIGLKRSAPPRHTVFEVNRPFLFAIWHEPTRTPLFIGHVVDPS